MRRTALLLAAPVLALGLLAGCDLPGGTPPSVSYDRMPNDTTDGAATVRVPGRITGTVDANDQFDWYRLTPPWGAGQKSLVITCTGDVYVNWDVTNQASAEAVPSYCDGQPHALFNVAASSEIYIGAGYRDTSASSSPYSFRVEYGDPVLYN